MSDAQRYHDDLVAKGYPADQALAYTRQYYPDFTPMAAAPPAMPEAQPMPVEPMAQPVAAVPVEAAMQPMMAAPAAAAPVPAMDQSMIGMAPLPGMQPMEVAPVAMPTSPAGGGVTPLGWAAVGLIATALLLSLVAQFNGAWLAGQADDGTHIKTGLHSIAFDCSDIGDEANQTFCISTYAHLTTPMGEDPPENSTEMVHKGMQEGMCDRVEEMTVTMATALSGGDQDVIDTATAAAADAKAECMLTDEAGSTGGTWLWMGTALALLCTLMALLPKVGVDVLPPVVSANARWASMVAGVLMVLAVLLWRNGLPDDPDSVMGASTGVYLAIVAGIMAIASGVLDVLDGRSGQA